MFYAIGKMLYTYSKDMEYIYKKQACRYFFIIIFYIFFITCYGFFALLHALSENRTGSESDDEYGSDPVEIVNDWVTIAEDGYLTLRFRTKWGNSGIAHRVNLLTGVNPDDPYEVEFRHDAEGDDERKWGDGLVAFSLKDLPDTEGKTVTLKLRWQSYSGMKQANFKFCSRKTTESANLLHGSPKFVTEIE